MIVYAANYVLSCVTVIITMSTVQLLTLLLFPVSSTLVVYEYNIVIISGVLTVKQMLVKILPFECNKQY